jgi:diacylglycerol kinase family enzyme
MPDFLVRKKLPEKVVRRFQAANFELSGDMPAAFELDGERVGNLPAMFSAERERLRVIVP